MTLTFETTEQPKGSATRTKEPNPYTEAVHELHKARQTEEHAKAAVKFVIEMGDATGENKDQWTGVNKAQRQLREVGDEKKEFTVRSTVELNTPKKGEARITFWTTKRIVRTAKTTETAPAES